MSKTSKSAAVLTTFFSAALLAGCAGKNTLAENPGAANPNAASLRTLTRQVRFQRFRLCQQVWTEYEAECNRELIIHHGASRYEFCQAFARRGWPEQALPNCDRRAR